MAAAQQQPETSQAPPAPPATSDKQGETQPEGRGEGRGEGRQRRARSQEGRRRHDREREGGGGGGYYRDYRDSRDTRRYDDFRDERGYERDYRDRDHYGSGQRYRDSGYFDDHYYDESDYHRPLAYDSRSRRSRPLYRARSLPQRDFQSYQSDYYDIGVPHTRRPYSNLGDYGGYQHGINSYMGHDGYADRSDYIRPTSSQSDYSFPELYHNNLVGKRRRHLDPDYLCLSSPDLPTFSSTPYTYSSYNTSVPPLKPCLKRPVNLSIADKIYQNRKLAGTPSAFQPFSTISEDLQWDPYTQYRPHYRPASALGVGRSSRNLNQYSSRASTTPFRSEISRFTESLYNLAKPTPVKPVGLFPRVRSSHRGTNVSSFLNPSLPMKPVQNLDQINPYTGLPNIEFIPTTEYLQAGVTSSFLPDATPSPDTTARRVAAILEPHDTYSQLVEDLHTQRNSRDRLELLEHQMRNLSFQPPPPSLSAPPSNIYQQAYSAPSITPYQQYIPPSSADPTFLGNPSLLPPLLPSFLPATLNNNQSFTAYNPPVYTNTHHPLSQPLQTQTQTQYYAGPTYTEAQVYNTSYNPVYSTGSVQHNNSGTAGSWRGRGSYSNTGLGQATPIPSLHSVNSVNNLAFDQNQLDQAWAHLSQELQQGRVAGAGAGYSQPLHGGGGGGYSQPLNGGGGGGYSQPLQGGGGVGQRQPLQGVLDMMSIERINNITAPVSSSSTLSNYYKTAEDKKQKKLESTYEDLLSLPKMARSPSELDPIPSSEDELSRYNERRRQNILTLMNRGREGNVDLKKHQLSQKYREAKYIENRILGYVPSVLQDLQKLDLNKKLNEKNKEIDKTLRQISRSYEDRCKQREKMRSALSLVKEIPKMEFDQNNKLIAKEDTTLLSNIKKSKNSTNTIKMDDMEFEVTDEIMSMIYHKALKKRMGSKSSKPRHPERRRSKSKMIERSQDSSSEAEISDIMKNGIFKQKVEEFDLDFDRKSQLKCLQRYSPRHLNPLLPVLEDKVQDDPHEDAERKNSSLRRDNRDVNIKEKEILGNGNDFKLTSSKSKTPLGDLKELKFLMSEDPVPSPAPASNNEEPREDRNGFRNSNNGVGNSIREGVRDDIRLGARNGFTEDKRSDHTFVKSKSSVEFKSLPRTKTGQRRGSIDEKMKEKSPDLSEMRKSNINISKTARKHLGMAVTPVGVARTPVGAVRTPKHTADIDKIFQTIGLSSEGGSYSEGEKKESARENPEDQGREIERERECRISNILRSGIESNLNEIKETLALPHNESEDFGFQEETNNDEYSAEKKSGGREKLDSLEQSVRVSRKLFKDKEAAPSSKSDMRNSSRDYFKNFDVEKFCTKMDASLESSLGEETEQQSSCPSIVLTNDLKPPVKNSPSPLIPRSSLKTNSPSPRLTPEFVFSEDRVTTELHRQVKEKNMERVLELLQDPGSGINYRDQEGATPLQLAVRGRDLRLTEILLRHGADPNMTDSQLRTSLHHAGIHGGLDIIEVLLKYSLDYSAKEWSCKKDGVVTARKFLDGLKEKDKLFNGRNLASLTNNQGQSCVHLTSQAGYLEFLELLIENNPELDGADNTGLTALHLTLLSRAGGVGCLSALLAAGADTSRTDRQGRTPLLLAVTESQAEAVSCLLASGADTNTRDCQGNNLLHAACQNQGQGGYEVARLLPDNCLQANLNLTNSAGLTVLHLAIANKDQRFFSWLISFQPDLEILTPSGQTFLEFSLINFSPEICRALLEVWPGHLQFCQEENKECWLHFAAKTGLLQQAELLLQCGSSDVEARDANLQTPLHYAVLGNQIKMVNFLLARNANPQSEDKNGRTAVDIAKLRGYNKIEQILSLCSSAS